MKTEKEPVLYTAALARLKLSEEEQSRFMEQMGSVMEFADKLNELEISETDDISGSAEIFNVFRRDEVGDSYSKDEMLKNAPSASDGCCEVPLAVE